MEERDPHPELMSFAQAILLVPRDTLRKAIDEKRLTLYRRRRTLLLARDEVLRLEHREWKQHHRESVDEWITAQQGHDHSHLSILTEQEHDREDNSHRPPIHLA